MRVRSTLLAAALFCAPMAAWADNVGAVYVSLGAGGNFLQDQTQSNLFLGGVADSSRFNGTVSFDPGFVGVGAVGWGFGNGLRAELEGDYRYNRLRGFPGAVTFGSSEQKYGGFVNLLYDFDFGGPLRPYVGVGVGEQTVQWKNGYVSAPGLFVRLQHEDPDVAYQAILGASYDLPVPGLALTAEYRFTAQPSRHEAYGQYFAPGVDLPAEAHFSDDYNHSVLLGVRYAFNAAPAAPPPAMVSPPPVREPSRSYLVFFDWDRADLSGRARQVVAEAAEATTRVQVTRVEVDGHTDASGSASYNQGLSRRRAQAVASELVRDGVPRTAIDIEAFGETRPLVATADGVREPQNRRVEIILR